MNLIKNSVLTVLMALSLGASSIALAEDAAATEIIGHIEKAIAEIAKQDFNVAYIHEKAARDASVKITGHDEAVKQGVQSLIQAQVKGKQADAEKATAELNKALDLFKSINK